MKKVPEKTKHIIIEVTQYEHSMIKQIAAQLGITIKQLILDSTSFYISNRDKNNQIEKI